MMHLFVYGTLRRQSSHSMARWLEQRAAFIGPAKTPGRLYNLGRFPGMVEADGPDQWVFGDVYQLEGEEILRELDRHEGNAYERQLGDATLTDGRVIEAFAFWYRGKVDDKQRMMTGDFFGEP